MNGRIYDPVVGRFLSADPTVQSPSDLQSYNRYSYAAGNPLKYTDPTGYNVWKDGLGTVFNIAIGVASIAVCAGTSGVGCAVAFAISATAVNATAAIASGAPWSQVLATSAVGFGAGLLFGQIGGGLGVAIAGAENPAAAALGGFISGAAAAAVMTPLTGGSLGENIFIGGMHGAMAAAFSAAFAERAALSKAEAKMQERSPESHAVGAKNSGGKRADPLADRSRFASAEHDLNEALYGRYPNPQRAAEIALEFWDAKVDNVYLDRAISDYAETAYGEDESIDVTFNPNADKVRSARFLMSTAYHEGIVHAGQFRSGNYASYPKDGFFVNEIEALDGELGIASKLGLSSDDIGILQTLRDQFYGRLSGSPYQSRVDAGNYGL